MIATKDRLLFCGQQNRRKMLMHHLTSSIILWSRNRQKMFSALSVISHLNQRHEEDDNDNDDMMTVNMTLTVKKRLA